MSQPLQRLCDRFRALTRRMLLRLGLARLVSLVVVLAAGLILLDFLLRFDHAGRAAALAVLLAAAAWCVWADLARPLRMRWSDEQVLDYLDRTLYGGHDRLTNYAELVRGAGVIEADRPGGGELLRQAVEALAGEVHRVDLRAAVRKKAVRRWQWAAAAIVLAAVGGGWIVQSVGTPRHAYAAIGARRLLMPWAVVRWPDSTWFEPLSPAADTQVPEGEDLTVRLAVHGRTPDRVTLIYEGLDAAGRPNTRPIEQTMFLTAEGVAEYTFAKLDDSIRFHVAGGDGRGEPITVTVAKRPFLEAVTVFYRFPPYSGVVRSPSHDPQLAGLEGTEVRVDFQPSKPLADAWVLLDGLTRPIHLPPADGGRRFTWTTRLQRSGSYTVCLLDTFGNREKHAETYPIRVEADEPPTARLLAPAGDLTVTARARFGVEYEARDDYGLAEVRVMVARDDGPAVPLDEKITGPIPQKDRKVSAGRFDWDLAGMDLAAVRSLTFFLAARDVNPLRRDAAESARLRVAIRGDTEVQSQVLLASRALLTEALLGSNNQRWAYLDAARWLAGDPTAAEADALLKEALDEQAAARRAAGAMGLRYAELLEQMQRNRLEAALFSRRLEQIGGLIEPMARQRQAGLAAAIEAARPRDAAEDTPRGRAAKMTQVLKAQAAAQKSAVFEFSRILDLLRDWNDLQQVLVKSRRLKELQEQVRVASDAIPSAWVGREVEDLTDAEARQLETLGQQQEAIFEAESALEEEIQTLALAARAQGRKGVFDALRQCFELLRLRAVNEKILQCGRAIRDNRVEATLDDQAYVVKVFTFVVAQLEQAGAEVPALPPVDLRLAVVDERNAPVQAAAVPQTQPAGGIGQGLVFNPQSSIDVEDVGAYQVNTIEQAMVFLQSILDDQLLLYTRYTDARFRQRPPAARYRALRLGMLGVRCRRALDASAEVLRYAEKHPFRDARPFLAAMHADLEQIGRRLAAGQTGPAVQDWIAELSESLANCRRFLAGTTRMAARQADREAAGGKDPFGQRFVLTGPDLAAVAQMRQDAGWAFVLQSDVRAKCRRIGEPAARAAALQRQGQVLDGVRRLKAAAAAGLSTDELTHRVADEALAGLSDAPFAAAAVELNAGKDADALGKSLEPLAESLRTALANLESLADGRVRPVEQAPPAVAEARQAMEQVDLTQSPDALARQLEAARAKALHDFQYDRLAERVRTAPLDPQARRLLLDTLADEPDPQYRMLIAAYVNGLLAAPAEGREAKP